MNRRVSHRRLRWVAYVLAVGLAVATLWLRLALGENAGGRPMMILFIIPVMLCAYLGGLGPGLLATAAGAVVADFYLMPPLHSLAIEGANGVQWVAFIVVGALVSLLLEKTRRSALGGALELERERANLRAILDGVPALIFSKDREHRFVRVNLEMARAAGRTREEMEGRTDVELGSPDAERFHRDEEEIFASGLPKRNLIELLPTKQGDRWLQTEKIPQRNPAGEVVGLVGFAVDITDRLRAEEERTRLAAIVQGVSEACFALDGEWRFTFVNDRWETLFHRQRDEVIGRTIWTAFAHLRGTLDEAHFRRAMSERAPVSFETYSRGAERWLDVRLFPSGEGLAAFLLDISERKHVEERLRASEERLQAVTENLSEGLIVSDLSGRLVHWNRAGLEMHGYHSIEEGLHELPYFAEAFELASLDGEKIEIGQWPLPRVLLGGKLRDLAVRVRRLDSDWERVFSYSGSIVRDVQGRPLAYLAINDITERQKAEHARREAEERVQQFNAELERRVVDRTEQLEAANAELQAANLQLAGANKEMESFSYSVSHDLRAPLRAIAGFSQALDESGGQRLGETERGYLGRVRAAAERMGHLIDDLLDLSRVSRSEMVRRPVDLSGLARTIMDELRGRTPARVVEIEIEAGLHIEGDPRLLRTMLENLLGNAWKFTGKKGSAHIAFRCARSEPASVTFVISDDGAGFDMRYSGKLFGAFQRLHALAEFPGTGIGLATVQRIIHRHGGRIWAEGGVGAGAKFFFALPIPSLTKRTDADE